MKPTFVRAVALFIIVVFVFPAVLAVATTISIENGGGEWVLNQVRNVCGSKPDNCVSGRVLAWVFGTSLRYHEVDGIVVDSSLFGDKNDGFTVYDAKTGGFLQNVVFPYCNDLPEGKCPNGQRDDWWVEGYRPARSGEHVKVMIYSLYDFACPPTHCGSALELVYVTKLDAVAYVNPNIPHYTISVTVNGEDAGTYSDLGDAVDNTILPEIKATNH
jgi:hypothetical protein